MCGIQNQNTKLITIYVKLQNSLYIVLSGDSHMISHVSCNVYYIFVFVFLSIATVPSQL